MSSQTINKSLFLHQITAVSPDYRETAVIAVALELLFADLYAALFHQHLLRIQEFQSLRQ